VAGTEERGEGVSRLGDEMMNWPLRRVAQALLIIAGSITIGVGSGSFGVGWGVFWVAVALAFYGDRS
jgi:uncharacterized membrane protein YfcA